MKSRYQSDNLPSVSQLLWIKIQGTPLSALRNHHDTRVSLRERESPPQSLFLKKPRKWSESHGNNSSLQKFAVPPSLARLLMHRAGIMEEDAFVAKDFGQAISSLCWLYIRVCITRVGSPFLGKAFYSNKSSILHILFGVEYIHGHLVLLLVVAGWRPRHFYQFFFPSRTFEDLKIKGHMALIKSFWQSFCQF